ncbi:hypothetical protein MNB_SUP05-SYMBIONT-5-457 [hydrothermal vent metagenome]|uniref:Uncharacterized protein n=1 Tax=hydrothermal vent metagenome TaxID=652676 RepID=A0A1W1E658_9ZZZZ
MQKFTALTSTITPLNYANIDINKLKSENTLNRNFKGYQEQGLFIHLVSPHTADKNADCGYFC